MKIQLTSVMVDSRGKAQYDRPQRRGVAFRAPPTAMGPVAQAVFDDTCGDLIQIDQPA